jgi:hypothetical protein
MDALRPTLQRPVTLEEIRAWMARFEVGDAPGLDQLTAHAYIVHLLRRGDDLEEACRTFLHLRY